LTPIRKLGSDPDYLAFSEFYTANHVDVACGHGGRCHGLAAGGVGYHDRSDYQAAAAGQGLGALKSQEQLVSVWRYHSKSRGADGAARFEWGIQFRHCHSIFMAA